MLVKAGSAPSISTWPTRRRRPLRRRSDRQCATPYPLLIGEECVRYLARFALLKKHFQQHSPLCPPDTCPFTLISEQLYLSGEMKGIICSEALHIGLLQVNDHHVALVLDLQTAAHARIKKDSTSMSSASCYRSRRCRRFLLPPISHSHACC